MDHRMESVAAPDPPTLEPQTSTCNRNLPFEWTKEETLQLIEMYRECPCLWQVKSEAFKNRNQKNDAYLKLLKHIQTNNSRCTLDIIKKKLNTLRSQYRKELKLVEASKKSGSGTDELYEPKLWCFGLLSFLSDGEIQRESTSTVDSPTQDTAAIASETGSDAVDIVADTPSSVSQQDTPCLETRKPKKKSKTEHAESVMEYALQELQSLSSETDINDDAHHVGHLVERDLRAMDCHQRAIAKKLISDVLFYGNVGRLCHNSCVVCGQQE